MRFYDALQLDPGALKQKIREASSPGERRWFRTALVVRAVLLVAFSILFIGSLSALFGEENSAMAVVLFCILLSIRFVDFGYRIGDSLLNLAAVFFLLLAAPLVTQLLSPLPAFLVHFGALWAILLMTCEHPEMGNGGLYGFGYLFLTGGMVTGPLLWKRCLLTLLGYLLCGSILYRKHRHKHQDLPFRQVAARFDLRRAVSRWQLRLALGLSLLLALGTPLGLDRFLWAGFACSSLLSTYPAPPRERLLHRLGGAAAGSLLFAVVYALTPPVLRSLFGPLAGLCLGFCSDYRYKTAFNCFGALLLAAELYGVTGAVALRLFHNLLGVVFGSLFYRLFWALVERPFAGRSPEDISSSEKK